MIFGDILQKDKDGNVTLFYIGFSDGKHLAWSVCDNSVIEYTPSNETEKHVCLLKDFKEPYFKPFAKMIVASNIMHSTYLLDYKGYHPLIIGRDDDLYPHIWLYSRNGDKITTLVEDNIAVHAQVRCDSSSDRITVEILNPKNNRWYKVIRISIQPNVIPEIDVLDLRPIGLNIYSEKSFLGLFTERLVIGDKKFQGLEFKRHPSAFIVE